MNDYRLDDLTVGQSESFEIKITSEKMELFKRLTGDDNPLHTDEGFARAHGFSDKVTYGMLTASLISTLGGVYLPGKYCLIQQIKSKFLRPVYIGDSLVVRGTVAELHKSVGRATISIEICNQDAKKVVKAVLDVGFLE